MMNFITTYNKIIKGSYTFDKTDDTLDCGSLIALQSDEELSDLYHILIISVLFSVNPNVKVFIKQDERFYIYNKLPNVHLIIDLNDEDLLTSEDYILFYPDLEDENFDKMKKLPYCNAFYNSQRSNHLSDKIIYVVKDKNHQNVVYDNLTFLIPTVNTNLLNIIIRKAQQSFIDRYLESAETPESKLRKHWDNFIQDGKVKYGKLEELCTLLFNKKKNSKIVAELNSLIQKISKDFS